AAATVGTSHNPTVLLALPEAALPEARSLPSGLNATDKTSPVWPLREVFSWRWPVGQLTPFHSAVGETLHPTMPAPAPFQPPPLPPPSRRTVPHVRIPRQTKIIRHP